MQILFFTKGSRSVGSSRQRVWNVTDLLEGHGFNSIVVHALKKGSFSLVDLMRQIRKADVLFVHKAIFPLSIVVCIFLGKLLFRKKLIFDLDDAEWEHSRVKSIALAFVANSVFCGSHVILAWARRYNKKSILVPTVVNHETYPRYRVEHKHKTSYTLGWVGVGRGYYLEGTFAMVKPALDALARDYKFRFVIIGSQNYQPLKDYFKDAAFETVFIDELDWPDASVVPSTIRDYQFDIGLMPTSDTPFNRAKCAFKAIEYMACGVPVVASPVGENTRVVEEGVTGFHARTDAEWQKSMAALLGDTALRAKMGEAGMKKTRESYSYDVVMPTIKNVLGSMLQ